VKAELEKLAYLRRLDAHALDLSMLPEQRCRFLTHWRPADRAGRPSTTASPSALRTGGGQVDDEVLAHIWPTHHENVHFYGTHFVDVDGELARFDAGGYRPLRLPDAPAAS
jgi:hypothetical protein